jgi:biopolymer transport protein ExbD
MGSGGRSDRPGDCALPLTPAPLPVFGARGDICRPAAGCPRLNFQRGRSREEPDINLIPLIDVLLVILIFLLVSTTYSKYQELQINLPQAQGERTQTKAKIISVGVDVDGRYTVDGQLVNFSDVAEFSEQLKQAARGNAEPVVAIGADSSATHQSVVNIMAAARLAGFTHITFETQTPPGGK